MPYVPRVDGFVDHFVQQRGPQVRLPCKGESNAWPRPGPPGSRAFVVLAARFSSLFSAEPPPHVEPVLVGYRVEGVPANVDAASLPWLRAASRKSSNRDAGWVRGPHSAQGRRERVCLWLRHSFPSDAHGPAPMPFACAFFAGMPAAASALVHAGV